MTMGSRHSTCFFIASETTMYFSMFFDLIEVGGEDLRREPLEQRKIELRRLLADTEPGLVFNEWIDGDLPAQWHRLIACLLASSFCRR